MLFVPEKVPQCVLSDFATAFPPALASSDPVLARQIAGIIKSRNLFHQFVATSAKSADMNQEKYQHQVSEVLEYLDNATNFMEVLCKNSEGPLKLNFQTAITPSPKNFSVEDSHEITATVEIIFSRLGLVFAALQNMQFSAKDMVNQLNVSAEQYTNRLKHCLDFTNYAGVRMGKLNYLKRHLLSVFGTGMHKYGAVCELNWHFLEAIYLMIEVSYTSLFLLRVLTVCHTSIPSLVYWGNEKNEMLKEILGSLESELRAPVIKYFYTDNREFFVLCPFIATWCQNWAEKLYLPERQRNSLQIDLDLNTIATEVLPKLDVQSNYFGQLVAAKHRSTIMVHMQGFETHKAQILSGKVYPKEYSEFEMKSGKGTEDRVRKHFVDECGLTSEEICSSI